MPKSAQKSGKKAPAANGKALKIALKCKNKNGKHIHNKNKYE